MRWVCSVNPKGCYKAQKSFVNKWSIPILENRDIQLDSQWILIPYGMSEYICDFLEHTHTDHVFQTLKTSSVAIHVLNHWSGSRFREVGSYDFY